MEKTIVEETADILKQLSPLNQAYFMTMVRVAGVAEKSVKQVVQESADLSDR